MKATRLLSLNLTSSATCVCASETLLNLLLVFSSPFADQIPLVIGYSHFSPAMAAIFAICCLILKYPLGCDGWELGWVIEGGRDLDAGARGGP